jgi:hypothetical protein
MCLAWWRCGFLSGLPFGSSRILGRLALGLCGLSLLFGLCGLLSGLIPCGGRLFAGLALLACPLLFGLLLGLGRLLGLIGSGGPFGAAGTTPLALSPYIGHRPAQNQTHTQR